jgi:hypothetical protein
MDKNDYLDTLKQTDLRPGKIKLKERKEELLIEEESTEYEPQFLSELFVQATEIENIPTGLVRDMQILRLSIIAEYDATNLYEKFAELTENENLKKVLLDVANEEKEHIGEFEHLLASIDLDHDERVDAGEEEAEELVDVEEPTE